MKYKTFLLTVTAAALIMFISGCGGQQDKPIRLTYSVFFPPTHVHAKLAAEWAAEVEKRCDGKVTVEVFPGGALTKPDACYQGVPAASRISA